MLRLEKSIEASLVNWLRKNKIKWKSKASGELLDRWILLPDGHLFVIELKRPSGKLSKLQVIEIDQLRRLGYDVEVHDEASEAIEAVKCRMEAARLSKEGHKVSASELMRGSILRSWAREDKYYPSDFESFAQRRCSHKNTYHCPVTGLLLRMAKRVKKVARV